MPKGIPKDEYPSETHSMRTEREFIPTISESLVESVRMNLPRGDEPEPLIGWVTRQPGLYSYFLGKLIAGSSFRAAAMSIALSPNRLTAWLQQGAADMGDDQDTYCSRLLLDCQRAAALAVGDAEERVHKLNPSMWLGKGPAKDFHKGRYWKESIGQSSIEDQTEDTENPLDPLPLRPVEQIEAEDTGDKDLEEAIKVLEGHQIITKPEFIEQARAQYRIQKPDDGKA